MAADVVLTTAHRTATYRRAVSDVIYRCPRRGCPRIVGDVAMSTDTLWGGSRVRDDTGRVGAACATALLAMPERSA
jgi:hypothetical protein